jgi:uncharacterized protein DUF4386
MRAPRNPGRVVGLWYLSLVLFGPLTLLYIPNKLFVHNDATATAANIAAHQLLFKVGMLADLGGSMLLIFLVFAFYRLFKDVDQQLALWLVITGGVMPAVLQLVNFVNEAGALTVAQGATFLNVFDKPQRDALVLLFVQLHEHQITAAEILWGAWLFPMGALTYKSGFLPRFIGVWLIINGIAYVLLSVSRLMLPEYSEKLFVYLQPALLGELVIVLWLVIKGAGQTPLRGAPDPASPPPRTR